MQIFHSGKNNIYLMFRTLLTLLFISCFSTSYPETFTSDTVQLRKQAKLLYYYEGYNLDSLIFHANKLLNSSERINYQYGDITAYIQISRFLALTNDKSRAILYLNKAIKKAAESQNPEWITNSYITATYVYHLFSDYKNAMEYSLKAKQIAEENHLKKRFIDIYNQAGSIHLALKDYDQAEKYFHLILDKYKQEMDPKQHALVLINLSNVYLRRKNYDNALLSLDEAIKLPLPPNNNLIRGIIYYNIATTYTKKNEFRIAEENARLAQKYFTDLHDNQNILRSTLLLGTTLTGLERFEDALECLKQSENIASRKGDLLTLSSIARTQALNYSKWREKTHNHQLYEKEIKYIRIWAAWQDSIYQRQKTETVLNLEKKYEVEHKNAQIALLEKESAIHKSRTIFLLLGLFISIGIAALAVTAYRYTKKLYDKLNAQNKHIEEQTQQIAHKNEELLKALNTQNKLFSIIAHDLRSPLATISNLANLIKWTSEEGDTERIKELAEKLDARNTQVLQLTDNLLTWAFNRTGRTTLRSGRININHNIREVIYLYQPIASQKNILINCETEADIEFIADKEMISTILRNLVNNAVKFTPKNGTVNIHYHTETNELIICVSDNGVGIDEENLKLLFEISDKKQRVGTHGEKSSGLGLVICKDFVEMNHGRIWVESQISKGSNFYLAFPLPDSENIEIQDKA